MIFCHVVLLQDLLIYDDGWLFNGDVGLLFDDVQAITNHDFGAGGNVWVENNLRRSVTTNQPWPS